MNNGIDLRALKYCEGISSSDRDVELICTYGIDEVDPYKKPKDLLEVSPKCLVPGLKLNNFHPPRALNESTVILEYINE